MKSQNRIKKIDEATNTTFTERPPLQFQGKSCIQNDVNNNGNLSNSLELTNEKEKRSNR